MDNEVFSVIQQAALRASRGLSDQLLEMSCFVSNWKERVSEEEEEPVEA